MGKISQKKIQDLIKKGKLVPVISSREQKHFLIGYKRKSTSRKNDVFMLPTPEEINVPNFEEKS